MFGLRFWRQSFRELNVLWDELFFANFQVLCSLKTKIDDIFYKNAKIGCTVTDWLTDVSCFSLLVYFDIEIITGNYNEKHMKSILVTVQYFLNNDQTKRKNSYNDWRVAKTSRYSASWTYRYSPKLWPCRASCSAHLYLRLREKFSVSDYEEAMSSAHLPAHLPAYLPAYHPAYFPNPIVVSIFETLILHLFFIGWIGSKAEHDL